MGHKARRHRDSSHADTSHAAGAYGAFRRMNDALQGMKDAVAAWNAGLDVLDIELVAAAGEHAIDQWTAMNLQLGATMASDHRGGAITLLQVAKLVAGRFGLHDAGHEEVSNRSPFANDPIAHIRHAIERARATIADAREMIELANAGGDGDTQMKIALVFRRHADSDEERRWLHRVAEMQTPSSNESGE